MFASYFSLAFPPLGPLIVPLHLGLGVLTKQIQQAHQSACPVIWKMPSPNIHFQGREDLLEAIHQTLQKTNRLALVGGPRDFVQAKELLTLIEVDSQALQAMNPITQGLLTLVGALQLTPEEIIMYFTDQGFLAAACDMDSQKSISYSLKALHLLEERSDLVDEKLRVLSNMLQIYTMTGEIEKATALLEQMKPTLEKAQIPMRRIAAVFAWVGLLSAQGFYGEALRLLGTVEDSASNIPDHPATYTSFLRNQAELLVRLKRTEEADAALKQLSRKLVDFYGTREPPIVGTCLMLQALGNLQKPEGPQEDDIQSVKKALKIYETTWKGGRKNVLQGFASFVLGQILEAKGDLKAARELYQKTEAVYDALLEHKNLEDVSALYAALVNISRRLHDTSTAETYIRKHIDVFGLIHPRTKELVR